MSEQRPAEGEATAPASPLRVVLHSLEEQLDERVEEVADAKPARQESTAELIHLEEELSEAQEKAKQLVTLRLKVNEDEKAT